MAAVRLWSCFIISSGAVASQISQISRGSQMHTYSVHSIAGTLMYGYSKRRRIRKEVESQLSNISESGCVGTVFNL